MLCVIAGREGGKEGRGSCLTEILRGTFDGLKVGGEGGGAGLCEW